MSLQEIIESFRTGLMWAGLWVLAAIVAGCIGVWLYRSAQSTTSLLRGLRTWIDGLVFTLLFTACVLIGGTKTNSPPMGLMAPLLPPLPQSVVQMVTDEDIARGYREVAETNCEASVYAMPDGITPSFNWHKRGTFGEWVRLDLGGFAFPLGTNDEAVTTFSVFNDGRMRPTPRDAAREICAVGAPMLAMQGASRFWTADGASGSKLLTWENFFLNADTNTPVNAQIELFQNGDFTTRSNALERIYRRVAYFDWDGDGLENMVDPDPLVAGADAHGTNAEWYNVVCSNIVNSNAYYFVDVVATNGPAPIYFTGDRESRLGNPVVVALGGETNHVPLLIGIDYVITSPVPFTVSFPDDGFATVTTNGVANYEVRWPLGFNVSPDGNGYRVSAVPYDPGCEFRWPAPTRSVTCNYTTDCGWIGFSCCGSGNCGCGGCAVSGEAVLDGTSFSLPDVWCGCWHYDPLDPGIGSILTNTPAVFVSFDKAVVFYEDAYTNAPNDVVAKHSTNTTLTVFAYGGEAGGMLYVSDQNIGKLVRTGGKAIAFPYTAFVPPQSGVSFSIVYEAETHSDSEGDITVTASLMPGNSGETLSDSASTTAVKVKLTSHRMFPVFRNRHVYGICEDVWCEWFPSSVSIGWRHSGEGRWVETKPTYRRFGFPNEACFPVLTVSYGNESYDMDLTCITPNSIDAKFENYMVTVPPPKGKAGFVGMQLQLTLMPTNVSFEGLYVEEIPTLTGTHTNYFAAPAFSNWWYHTETKGAGVWYETGVENIFTIDEVAMNEECLPPWSNGEIIWQIPCEWAFSSTNAIGSGTTFYNGFQRFGIDTEGTVSVEKFGFVISRNTNDVFSLSKRIMR